MPNQTLTAGIVDAYWEYRLKPWDVAAGVMILEEAGGMVTTMDGLPYRWVWACCCSQGVPKSSLHQMRVRASFLGTSCGR